MVSNGPMCESFRENWAALGQPDWPSVEEDKAKALSGGGSTDMGNMCALNSPSSSHPFDVSPFEDRGSVSRLRIWTSETAAV